MDEVDLYISSAERLGRSTQEIVDASFMLGCGRDGLHWAGQLTANIIEELLSGALSGGVAAPVGGAAGGN